MVGDHYWRGEVANEEGNYSSRSLRNPDEVTPCIEVEEMTGC